VKTQPRAEAPAAEPARQRFPVRFPSAALAPVAGPALIVAAVLVVLRPFAFGGMLTTQHVDILPLWLPTHCFLGSALRHGHIPAWNPFAEAGARFAADPQSGWLYLPAMSLDTALPCARALGWFITLQPAIAGLAIYAFLRSEGCARAAATVGGLCLALSVAASYTALSVPLSGALAWSAVTLAAASRLWRAETWTRRFLWLLAVALAWGQLASAHMSQGLLLGTAALAAYLIARFVMGVRSGGTSTARRGLALTALVVVFLPLVNLGILLPRISYFEHSSLASGYRAAEERAGTLQGRPPTPVVGETGASEAGWPLAAAVTPGWYLGVAAVALLLAAPWSRRHRPVALALIAFGAVTYVLSLRSVAESLSPHVGRWRLGDIYLHAPARLRFGVLLVAPVLAGLGADAWRERRRWRQRVLLLLPAAAVFGVLPTVLGYRWDGQLLPLAGLVAGGTALMLSAGRPGLLWLLPVVLAVELSANGVAGQTGAIRPHALGPLRFTALGPLRDPNVSVDAYLREGPIVRAIRSGGVARYLPLALKALREPRGYLLLSRPSDWPLEANQRSMLFGIEDVGGSDNPLQSSRYWSFVRAVSSAPLGYNAAFFSPPDRVTRDLMQIRWVIQAAGRPPLDPNAAAVAREGHWTLYRLPHVPGRASVVQRWVTAPSPDRALHAVTEPSFDPRREVVLESSPGIPRHQGASPRPGHATADFVWHGPQAATVRVRTPRPAIVLVRNTFDSGWHATVDGRPASVQPADYVAQGIAVQAGRHVVELTYDDPTIGYGVIGSGVAILLILGAALAARTRERTREQR
jgi:hypothetical protein